MQLDTTASQLELSNLEERLALARVLELDGDTLLFGERGRSARVSDVPQEITRRRDELVTQAQAPHGQTEDGAAASAADGQASGELWYYGAPLRCNQ
jgi:hypothetical protein